MKSTLTLFTALLPAPLTVLHAAELVEVREPQLARDSDICAFLDRAEAEANKERPHFIQRRPPPFPLAPGERASTDQKSESRVFCPPLFSINPPIRRFPWKT